jgi:hypothetical protein
MSKKPILPPLATGPLPLAPIRDAARKQLIDVIDSVRCKSHHHRRLRPLSQTRRPLPPGSPTLNPPPSTPLLNSAAAARPCSWTQPCPDL